MASGATIAAGPLQRLLAAVSSIGEDLYDPAFHGYNVGWIDSKTDKTIKALAKNMKVKDYIALASEADAASDVSRALKGVESIPIFGPSLARRARESLGPERTWKRPTVYVKGPGVAGPAHELGHLKQARTHFEPLCERDDIAPMLATGEFPREISLKHIILERERCRVMVG